MVTTVILTTTGTGNTWLTPADWNAASNNVYVLACGGSGGTGAAATGAGGGGSGSYADAANLTLTGAIAYQVATGAGGITVGGAGASWFNGTAANAASAGARGGATPGGSGGGGAAGISTGNSGSHLTDGAIGGAGGAAKGGGGGSAPPGSGGSPAVSGTAGGAANGGNGGTNGDGGAGAGGSGGTSGAAAVAGTAGTNIGGTVGSGGGGGGGAVTTNTAGATGGLYGAGGGGSYNAGTPGVGRQGVIVITYTPVPFNNIWAFNPQLGPVQIHNRTQAKAHPLGITEAFFGLAGTPNFDWPNPVGTTTRQTAFPRTLRTFIDPLKLNLIGQDAFFGLAGHPNFDWPNPIPYRQPITNKTFALPMNLSLRGTDAFPARGQVYGYPNPLRAGRLWPYPFLGIYNPNVIPPPFPPLDLGGLIPTILNLGQLQLQLNTLFQSIIDDLPYMGYTLPTASDYADGKFFTLLPDRQLYQVISGSWVRLI